jgi:DNA-binding NarL/FixJ family response regulator
MDALGEVLAGRVSSGHRHDQNPDRPLADLSRMQLEVLKLVAMGKSNQQIAEERDRSLGAVESMLSRIFAILGIDASADGNARVEASRQYMVAAGIPLAG